jgi:hypothetical protein
VLDVFIGMFTPWDPTILSSCSLSNDEKGDNREALLHTTSLPQLKRYEKPSYMAIKKVLYRRQPGYISFEVFFPCYSKSISFSVFVVV